MRLTVRLRLTLLYGALFLCSGAALLAFTYLLVDNANGGGITKRKSRDSGQTVTYVWGEMPGGRLPADVDPEVVAEVQERMALQRADLMHKLLVLSGEALAVMSVVSVGIGWVVAGRVLRPIQTMTGSIQRISAHNVHERLAVPGPRDELRDLADTVDGLLGRPETALDSHRRFVANAAHELRTPLTLEHALLEEAVLDPDATLGSYRAQFTELLAASEQQARLLESLLVLATSERGLDRAETVDLSAVAGELLRARPAGAELGPALVTGDAVLLERLVANLVDNAAEYNVEDGWIKVVAGTEDRRAFLSVANSGPVVPPEMVDLLLHPFQRLGRTAGDGHHGLGLSVVAAIAAAHAADLTVQARPEGGLDIRVLFPAAAVPGV